MKPGHAPQSYPRPTGRAPAGIPYLKLELCHGSRTLAPYDKGYVARCAQYGPELQTMRRTRHMSEQNRNDDDPYRRRREAVSAYLRERMDLGQYHEYAVAAMMGEMQPAYLGLQEVLQSRYELMNLPNQRRCLRDMLRDLRRLYLRAGTPGRHP